MITILQGDQLTIPLPISIDGEQISPEQIVKLNVTIGTGFTKSYPGDITVEDDVFQLRITQEESFRLPVGKNTLTVRPKFANNDIRGVTLKGAIEVLSSADKTVM